MKDREMNLDDLIKNGTLPKIHVTEEEDNSILIEWIFPGGARIGLNIEKDKRESGWNVVSKQIIASGPLYEEK